MVASTKKTTQQATTKKTAKRARPLSKRQMQKLLEQEDREFAELYGQEVADIMAAIRADQHHHARRLIEALPPAETKDKAGTILKVGDFVILDESPGIIGRIVAIHGGTVFHTEPPQSGCKAPIFHADATSCYKAIFPRPLEWCAEKPDDDLLDQIDQMERIQRQGLLITAVDEELYKGDTEAVRKLIAALPPGEAVDHRGNPIRVGDYILPNHSEPHCGRVVAVSPTVVFYLIGQRDGTTKMMAWSTEDSEVVVLPPDAAAPESRSDDGAADRATADQPAPKLRTLYPLKQAELPGGEIDRRAFELVAADMRWLAYELSRRAEWMKWHFGGEEVIEIETLADLIGDDLAGVVQMKCALHSPSRSPDAWEPLDEGIYGGIDGRYTLLLEVLMHQLRRTIRQHKGHTGGGPGSIPDKTQFLLSDLVSELTQLRGRAQLKRARAAVRRIGVRTPIEA